MNDEVSMARTQLKTIIENATKLMQMSQDGDQYDAWVQAKLTKAADYLQSVYNYQSTEQ
jgi:3-methyladenine DNA glycosylase Tag